MEQAERMKWMKKASAVRVELKSWEKAFAAANHGKKASRDDIKQNPGIAQRYKEYNKIRDILAGNNLSEPEPFNEHQTPRKRKNDEIGHGISTSQNAVETPSKGATYPWEVDPYDSPSLVRNLFTPSKKLLGPTPQKDGQVLGLFDLVKYDEDFVSPTRNKVANTIFNTSAQATPSRRPILQNHNIANHSRTPDSSEIRHVLDELSTPSKPRITSGSDDLTPSSASRLHVVTPSFLRRDSRPNQPTLLTQWRDGTELLPETFLVPRKPLARGLSSILAGLRNIQDDAADEDLEALREMEMEEANTNKLNSKPISISMVSEREILETDKQSGFLVGGFDDPAKFDDSEQVKDHLEHPRKVYKKKGQKRTTRRVRMKPSHTKPRRILDAVEEDCEDQLAPVPKMEVDVGIGFENGARKFDSDSQSDYTASEGGTRYRRPKQAEKDKRASKNVRVKTATRKVGTTVHQNFKRLKLRNTGTKSGSAHNSRFRRKR